MTPNAGGTHARLITIAKGMTAFLSGAVDGSFIIEFGRGCP